MTASFCLSLHSLSSFSLLHSHLAPPSQPTPFRRVLNKKLLARPHRSTCASFRSQQFGGYIAPAVDSDFLDSDNITLSQPSTPHCLFPPRTLPMSFWGSHRDVHGPSPVRLHVVVSASICYPSIQVTHKSAVPPTACDFRTVGNMQHLVERKASL